MRSKLTLKLEDLSVDSFDTTTTQKAKGTVFGEQCTCYTNCTCPGCPTCYASCNGTCDASCNGTCGASCNGTCNCPSGNTCDWSCEATACDWGYTCGNCTALQTNCNQVCL
ncbi:MAG TPA: hypothetical protein VEQ60_07245 [Longimicrobium sp.]|nr:hypothetical protein [Longimicrobium sp.]